jgi:hypothetical protein
MVHNIIKERGPLGRERKDHYKQLFKFLKSMEVVTMFLYYYFLAMMKLKL